MIKLENQKKFHKKKGKGYERDKSKTFWDEGQTRLHVR